VDVNKIDSVVRALGTKTSVKGNKIRCNCILAPWTHAGGRDNTPSMVIFPEGRHGDPIYSCQACHRKGSLRDLLCFLWHKTRTNMLPLIEVLDSETEQIPDGVDVKAWRRQKSLKGLTFEGAETRRVQMQSRPPSERDGPWFDHRAVEKAKEVPEIPWAVYEPYAGRVPRYAMERGISKETCKEWELGHDPGMKRLLFPMRDRDGRLVAISGRLYYDRCMWCDGDLAEEVIPLPDRQMKVVVKCSKCGKSPPPKYLHNDGFQRNLHIYGENRVEDGRGRLYLVEGHIDALILWQYGYRPSGALLGSYPGEIQIEKIIAYWDGVVPVGDGDDAGRDMTNLVQTMIADRIPVIPKVCPRGLDPAKMAKELGPEALVELLGKPPVSVPIFDAARA